MPLDYFQYQVNKLWYRLYWALMFGFSVLVAGLYFLTRYVPSFAHFGSTLNIGHITLVAALINVVYFGTVYWVLKRYSTPFASLVGSMVFSLLLLNGMSHTDPHPATYAYVVLWWMTIFLNGTYGLPLLVGTVFVTYVYTSMQSHFELGQVSDVSMMLLGVSVVFALGAYFFWRNRFVSIEAQQLHQLSGQLKSNQQQSEILIQSIADGVIVINPEGKITLMNPSASQMTGWPVNEATGLDAQSVVKLTQEGGADILPEDNPFNIVLNQKQHVNQTLEIADRQGNKQVISLVISPIVVSADASPLGAVAVMRDVSEERAAEKQRAEFISTASHEMRTPVAAIEGYLALALNEKVSTIDSRARSYLDKAHASTQHLGKLFQDLLTSSKAEDGRLSNHPAVVEMGAFLQQLTDDLKFAAEKKGLLAEFIVGGADDAIDATAKDATQQHLLKPLYYVYADADRMREVITNLFDNACKYTDSGKISIGLTGNTDVVQMYVRDTGAGIPADDIPHLFQKFYRVDNSATRTIGGTGLGLFICRKIVELYHGRIWVESEVGKGSTFFINLPRLSSQRAAELQASEAAKGAETTPAAPTAVAPAAATPTTATKA